MSCSGTRQLRGGTRKLLKLDKSQAQLSSRQCCPKSRRMTRHSSTPISEEAACRSVFSSSPAPMQLFSRAWRRPSRTSCNQPTGRGPVAMAADSLPEECRFAARAAARTECSQHGVTDLNGLHRAFQMRAKAVLRVLARLWASHTGC
jgi:hypothetical protein